MKERRERSVACASHGCIAWIICWEEERPRGLIAYHGLSAQEVRPNLVL